MKNIYIIALRKWHEPVFLQQKVLEDFSYIGKCYEKAYIAENKKQANEIWGNWYKLRVERKADPKYQNERF